METDKIPFEADDVWLTDALVRKFGKKEIPSNIILAKTLCGIGATYSEIDSKRHSIIIEPNVPVIIGKKEKNPDVLAVYGNGKRHETEIINYFQSANPKYKKILTTPEGFIRVKKAAIRANVNIFKDYFCLFDECEKITQDVEFRIDISKPIKDFFEFKGKAFVSATPLKMEHPKLIEQEFVIYEIEPEYDYRKKISLIITSNFLESVVVKLINDLNISKLICIFYSSIKGINNIITTLGIQSESKIFCSTDFALELKKLDAGFENSTDEINSKTKFEKYNFFTSRFFSAVDIDLEILPDILILSNYKEAHHSLIDPFTESIQIQGRFRYKESNVRNFNTLTHITTIKPDLEFKEEHQIKTYIDILEANYLSTKHKINESINDDEIWAHNDELKKLGYNDYLFEDEINYYAIDNHYNAERVKKYYTSEIRLRQAYEETKHFTFLQNPEFQHHVEFVSRFTRGKSFTANVENIVDAIKGKSFEEVEKVSKLSQPFFGETNFILKAYSILGNKILKHNLVTIKTLYNKELEKIEIAEKPYLPEILIDIKDEFQHELNTPIPTKDVMNRLQAIFTLYKLNDIASLNTINKYFELTRNKDKMNNYIKLKYLKSEHQLKIDMSLGK